MRHRGAGHGLDRGRARAARPATGRQLVRLVPRVPRERADLQPGERGLEGRLRAPLRRADPRRPGEVAPVREGRLPARRAAGDDDVQPGTRRRRARSCAGRSTRRPRTSRSGSRSVRHRGGSSCPRAMPGRGQCCGRAPTRSSWRTARSCCTRRSPRPSSSAAGVGLAVVSMPWLNRVDRAWLADALGAYETIFVLEDHAPVGGTRRRAAPRTVRSRDRRLRGRGLAGVRDARGGAARPRTRRRSLASGSPPGSARAAMSSKRAWFVLPDQLSTRLFVDTGIVCRAERAAWTAGSRSRWSATSRLGRRGRRRARSRRRGARARSVSPASSGIHPERRPRTRPRASATTRSRSG